MGHQPPMSPTMINEIVQKSKIQAEIEVLTTESQNLTKENERLQPVIRITVTENKKTKNNNQTFLKAKGELALRTAKFTADQQVFESLTCHYQSKREEMKGNID
jgi:regulator of replication initiation timing